MKRISLFLVLVSIMLVAESQAGEPVLNLIRSTGHGWGRTIQYRDPGYHTCYYNPWTETNTPRFAFTIGEPDCHAVGQGCAGANPYTYSFDQNAIHNLPIREVTEPQFPPSQNAQVESGDDTSKAPSLLESLGSINGGANNSGQDKTAQVSAPSVSVLTILDRK